MSRLRVAVTGAGGKVGSALVTSLGASGDFEVVAIVRNALGAKTLGPVKAEIRTGSVTDPESSRRMLAGCDAVINCALPKGWPRTTRRIGDAILNNIANAPSVRIAVHFSSVAVYGSCVDPRRNSFERPRPTSDYGIDKLRSEKIAAQLFSRRGIRHYILRLGHVYGPSQWISADVLTKTADPSFSLPFGGDIPSNAVSIYAVIDAIRGMLNDTQPTGLCNLIDSPQSSWRDIYDYHTELLGRPAAGSISDAESRAWQLRYFAEARAPLHTVLRAAQATLRSADFSRLAQHIALRRILYGPLLLTPSWLEERARQAYVQRKGAAAVRKLAGAGPAPAFMYAPPVPGPTFNTIHKSQAAAAMAEEMRAYLSAMSSYRWNLTDSASDPPLSRSSLENEKPQLNYLVRQA
jgi:nucleoside-diphosphate-sugar epimerase